MVLRCRLQWKPSDNSTTVPARALLTDSPRHPQTLAVDKNFNQAADSIIQDSTCDSCHSRFAKNTMMSRSGQPFCATSAPAGTVTGGGRIIRRRLSGHRYIGSRSNGSNGPNGSNGGNGSSVMRPGGLSYRMYPNTDSPPPPPNRRELEVASGLEAPAPGATTTCSNAAGWG